VIVIAEASKYALGQGAQRLQRVPEQPRISL
jgi:hypothetical protein